MPTPPLTLHQRHHRLPSSQLRAAADMVPKMLLMLRRASELFALSATGAQQERIVAMFLEVIEALLATTDDDDEYEYDEYDEYEYDDAAGDATGERRMGTSAERTTKEEQRGGGGVHGTPKSAAGDL